MDEAAPGEAAAAAEKKRPLLRRVPTSLIVTLLGIALTAWLLPAIARQWDDRQKAHEIQAGLITDMASATARVLADGAAMWDTDFCGIPVFGLPTGSDVEAAAKPLSAPAKRRFRKCVDR